jgi:autotransporter-associated beta strand protein
VPPSTQVTLTVGGNHNSPTFSGLLTNSGVGAVLNLVKVGTGTQSLSGTNYINGAVTVQQGVLALSSAANLTASTSVTVEAGATLQAIGRSDGAYSVPSGQVLKGDGTIIGILTNSGVVAPGLPVGTLILTGNFSQAASGSLQLALASTSSYDSLRSSGSALLGGTLDVSLDSFAPTAGDQFTVLRFTSRTGGFATTNLPALSSGLGWTVTYLSTGVVLAVTGGPAGGRLWRVGVRNHQRTNQLQRVGYQRWLSQPAQVRHRGPVRPIPICWQPERGAHRGHALPDLQSGTPTPWMYP